MLYLMNPLMNLSITIKIAKELQEYNLIGCKYTDNVLKNVKTNCTQRIGMYDRRLVPELQEKTRISCNTYLANR